MSIQEKVVPSAVASVGAVQWLMDIADEMRERVNRE
jgi:hypothetical protein